MQVVAADMGKALLVVDAGRKLVENRRNITGWSGEARTIRSGSGV